ncbi:hypothetical protein [Halarchaeum sp. P4]|uniref:hypothetical protein n=1 Tax=Halarchaeum sp. P4 TaxID=3421639 RepID=UPI003EC1544A
MSDWLQAVAETVDVEEHVLRAVASELTDELAPPPAEREASLDDVVSSIFYRTRSTPFDNAPRGQVTMQFPVDGTIDIHYEYHCTNPAHPAPDGITTSGGRNWTTVTHTITTPTGATRDVLNDLAASNESRLLEHAVDEPPLRLRYATPHAALPAIKRILRDGFAISPEELVDVTGTFASEWTTTTRDWSGDD